MENLNSRFYDKIIHKNIVNLWFNGYYYQFSYLFSNQQISIKADKILLRASAYTLLKKILNTVSQVNLPRDHKIKYLEF